MPTTRLAYALLAAAVLAVVAGPLPGIALASLLIALALLDLRRARDRPQVTRSAPVLLSRGVAAPVEIEVARHGGRPVTVHQPAAADLSLDNQQADESVSAQLVAARRGHHVLPAVVARVTGPLGLARRRHTVVEAAELDVYPDLPAAQRLVLAVRRSQINPAGERTQGPLGLGTEFDRIRDYRPEDDLRQINWKATARVGRPMSNQHRIEVEQELRLLIDSGRLTVASVSNVTVLDVLLDIATALALVADELGDRCGALAFDELVHHAIEPRRGGGRNAVHRLHDLEPRPVDSDYEQAFRRAAGGRRSFVAVLCDLFDEHSAAGLVAALPVLTRRHTVAVIVPLDPSVRERLTTPPATDAEALEMLALLDLDRARQRAASLVRATGAQVIEAEPRVLARAAVRAYLSARLTAGAGARPALATSAQ